MVTLWVILVFSSVSKSQLDKLIGFDCSIPEDVKFIQHKECMISTHKSLEMDRIVVQKKDVEAITGFECSISITTLVNYCGAYSHTKDTGESTYGVPLRVSGDECKNMVEKGFFSTDHSSFPIKMNGLTYFNLYTHGSISMTGSNIACTGAGLSLRNGQVNTNMLRSLHFTVSLKQIHLTRMDRNIINPTMQIVVGRDDEEVGFQGSKTYIWNKIDKDSCNLLKISKVTFKSHGNTLFSDDRRIALSAKHTFHDSKCKIMVTSTTLDGVYLVDPAEDISLVHLIDAANIHLNDHYAAQIRFLNYKVQQNMQGAYSDGSSPTCHPIQNSPATSTAWVSGKQFIRNLGDCSVSFSCKQLVVAPILNSTRCFARLPVQDISGKTYFLDQANRMLMNHSPPSPCQPSLLPAYRNQANEIVIYSPHRVLLNVDELPQPNDTSQYKTGLYSSALINDWLQNSYLQSFADNAFPYIFDSFCSDCRQQQPYDIGFIQEQWEKVSQLSPPTFFWGFSLEKVGNICSIIVVVVMTLNLLFMIVSWAIKICIFQKGSTKISSTIARACCADLYIISKTINEEDNSSTLPDLVKTN